MSTHKLLLLLALVSFRVALAQTQPPHVINSGGGVKAVGDMTRIYSIGESVTGVNVGFIPVAFAPMNVAGIVETEKQDGLFFPNPVRGILYTSVEGEGLTFEVYSLQGKVLLTTKGNSIEMHSLAAAPYLVILRSLSGTVLTSEVVVKVD